MGAVSLLVFLMSLCVAGCDIVIRPSDYVLSGAEYHHSHDARRVASTESQPLDLSPGLIHHIGRPFDVRADTPYEADFWGEVNFAPVPKFRINTHDPERQDVYVSASVHAGKEPWDVFVWDRLVALLLRSRSDGHTPLFVDVGANLGYFSLAAASLGAHVIAFEPMSRNARKFSKSILANRFENRITLFQNAAWAEGPSFSLALHATSQSNQGNGQVLAATPDPNLLGGVYGVDYVSTVSLSHIVREDVDVMKIDVEGSESVVVAGAKRLICNFSVRHILMEFTEVKKRTDDEYSAAEMLRFFVSVGYTISDVTPDAPPLSVEDYAAFPPNILFTLNGSRAVC